ncbi:MAG: hypothetical protein LBF49_02950 [Puniceicoccales bacterium]|jgi:hypothetical protein|nr:hypothetical protein [Puniceicoccales bacterium]
MSFGARREINFNAEKRIDLGEVILPGGEFLASGEKVSFRPRDEQTVFGYETNGNGNIVKHFINGKQVSLKTWNVEITKNEGLRNSNFGKKPLCGVKSLVSREASRFLEPPTPREVIELPIPQGIKGPSTPPAEKMAKKMAEKVSTTAQSEKMEGKLSGPGIPSGKLTFAN